MAITTVKQRSALAVRREPYWHLLATGQHLGFRKTDDGGHWIARAYDSATRERRYQALGDFRAKPDNERFDEAVAAARAWFDHLAAGGQVEPISVGDAFRRYIAHKRKAQPAIADDAQRRYARHIEGDPIETVPLAKLKPVHLDEWRARMGTRPATMAKRGPKCRVKTEQPAARERTAGTVNRDLVPMRAALNLAKRQGFVTSDFAWAESLRPTEKADGRRTLYIDAGARRALIAALPDDAAAFVRALALLPLRPGAMASLRVADFDARHGTLMVRVDKAGAGRTVPLPENVVALFRKHAKSKLPAAPLLSRADGSAWSKDSWKKPIANAARAAELPAGVTAYTLRHAGITDLVTAGLDLFTVATLCGTSVAMIEKHYGQLRQDVARKALAGLNL